jgi:SAM-dependent methyltransferase
MRAGVLRGLAHASLLFSVAHVPGGRRAYHAVTRGVLRSQERVVRKLARVWPGYVGVWRERCGLELDGRRVWVHEPGPAPFAPLAVHLLTGRGALVSSTADPLADRYVGSAVRGVLGAAFTVAGAEAARRRATIAAVERANVEEVMRATRSEAVAARDPGALPFADGAADLCHSGGALEHYPEDRLRAFLRASFRVLRPGGVSSHVYDHRDHLRHVDARWPFLAHMALPDAVHRALFGHDLLFHNRLAPREVLALFAEAGFELVAVRRFVLPQKRYVDGDAAAVGEAGVPSWLRGGRLDRLTREDRHTAAIHYLHRKPERPCPRP